MHELGVVSEVAQNSPPQRSVGMTGSWAPNRLLWGIAVAWIGPTEDCWPFRIESLHEADPMWSANFQSYPCNRCSNKSDTVHASILCRSCLIVAGILSLFLCKCSFPREQKIRLCTHLNKAYYSRLPFYPCQRGRALRRRSCTPACAVMGKEVADPRCRGGHRVVLKIEEEMR